MSEPAAFYRKGELVNLLSRPGLSYLDISARKLHCCQLSFGKPHAPSLQTHTFLFRSLWKLDLCTVVLPQIEKLLQSKYER